MKTSEVNETIVGRRCIGIAFGDLVSGVITAVEKNEYVATVYFRFDEPVNWGCDIYTEFSNWARLSDEFGSLYNMKLVD